MKNGSLKITTLLRKKTALVLLGLILSVVFFEVGMRLGGLILLSIQEYGNLRSIQQKGAYRILCLGESTTQGQYPHLLEQVLNRSNTGVRFSVVDKGVVGTNTTVILRQVESYLAEYHPDMVVAMMGSNDGRVNYYQDIPEADTWIFRHSRVYRLGRILYMHFLKRIKREGVYGLNEPAPGRKAGLENAGTVVEKLNLSNKVPVDKVPKLGPESDNESPGTRNAYPDRIRLPAGEKPLRKAIELDPKNVPARLELGRIYLNRGKFAQAEDLFKKSIELDPKNDDAYSALRRLYHLQGEFPQAEEFLKKIIEFDPENDNAYSVLGLVYSQQRKFSQSEDAYKKAWELNPKNHFALVGLGGFYRFQGKFSEAEDLFKKAIELDPKNDNAYIDLGQFYRSCDKLPQAEDAFKKAVELNPKNERICQLMASLSEEIGRPEYAKKVRAAPSKHYGSMTVNNYRRLKKILDKRGTRLVCVQYPMRDVAPLKEIFENDEGLIFVDNEKVFKKALKQSSYGKYFVDIFAGDFGHCTPKGNMLLAQNIADVILREVFKKP